VLLHRSTVYSVTQGTTSDQMLVLLFERAQPHNPQSNYCVIKFVSIIYCFEEGYKSGDLTPEFITFSVYWVLCAKHISQL